MHSIEHANNEELSNMTQIQTNTLTAESVTNKRFNLIIVDSRSTAEKVIKTHGLTDARYIDDITHLPSGGPKRGEALARLINDTDSIVSLIVIHDRAWIIPLLDYNANMAPMVWRSIETATLGHRTDSERELIIVALNQGVSTNTLRLDTVDKLPSSWKQPRTIAPRPKAPVTTTMSVQHIKNKENGHQQQQPATVPQASGPMQKGPHKPKVRQVANAALYDDLYLLIKGEYGVVDTAHIGVRVRHAITFHLGGIPDYITDEMLVTHLVKTFTTKGSKSTWRAFEMIAEIAIEGSKSPAAVIMKLVQWISMIPARDSGGQLIPQPTINPELLTAFKTHVINSSIG
jgi:hypothetical protein